MPTSPLQPSAIISPVIAPVMDHQMLDAMKGAATDASGLLKSLSHPDRLMLLCQLTQGEYCVSELEQMTGIQQPSLSQQLGILRKDDLVDTRRDGKQIYYRIISDHAMAVLLVLYERFCPQPTNG